MSEKKIYNARKFAKPKGEKIVYAAPIPGRNTLCECGSGKKFKNCCWLIRREHSQI